MATQTPQPQKVKFNRVGATNRTEEAKARAQNAREADAVAVGDIHQRPPGNLRVETSVGWVDINTVFPMGSEVINISGEPNRGQPRQYFDEEELQALADDIKENGQEVPILVRRVNSRHASHAHEYGIIGGERRWRALNRIGAKEILVRVMDANTRRAYRRAVINDVHNVSHSPVERGRSLLEFKKDMEAELAEMLEQAGFENLKKPLTPAQIAKVADVNAPLPMWVQGVLDNAEKTRRRPTVNWEDVSTLVGLSYRSIADYVRAAGLGEEIVKAMQKGELSTQHAMIIASVEHSGDRKKLFRQVVKNKLTREQTREEAQKLKGITPEKELESKIAARRARLGLTQKSTTAEETPVEPNAFRIVAAMRVLESNAQTEAQREAARREFHSIIDEAWASLKRLGEEAETE
ncbi:MAG: ParB/RepB/Spo0J family partition protein [Armatimonadetes bacterium]|nr:ParB/RepB/Spo0J family partition protein [Armatimonadota bacterium]